MTGWRGRTPSTPAHSAGIRLLPAESDCQTLDRCPSTLSTPVWALTRLQIEHPQLAAFSVANPGAAPPLTDTRCDHLPMNQRPPGHSPAEVSGRHRGQGHRPIKPPGFWSEFKRNPRGLSFVVCAGLFAIGWGTETALSDATDAPIRLAGAASATGGMLIWLSYILYFRPGSLALPSWQQVPGSTGGCTDARGPSRS